MRARVNRNDDDPRLISVSNVRGPGRSRNQRETRRCHLPASGIMTLSIT
jgi:hypothetical protein